MKIVTLCMLSYKEARTNFALLSQFRNMIEKFMRNYLYRPIKPLQFFKPRKIRKCFT